MNLGLEGKVVIVTGGSKGIGLACARALSLDPAGQALNSSQTMERRASSTSPLAAFTL